MTPVGTADVILRPPRTSISRRRMPTYGCRMPTLPSQQPPSSNIKAHEARGVAESFGVDAEGYNRSRPRYPAAMVDRIVAASPGRDFLDVGSGTGIASRQFQAVGCRVTGVEPDTRMAEFARSTGINVEVATFEDWDPAGRTFDAVVAGQAWHWVDPTAGAGKAGQVLRRRGRLAVFAHVFDPPAPIAEAFATVFQQVMPDAPFNAPLPGSAFDIAQKMFASFADGIRDAGGFTGPEHWRFDWEHTYTRDQWLALLPTTGGLTRLPADKLTEVLDVVGAAVDALGGSFTMPYITLAVTSTRP